jgi:hypothetical protein
MPPYSIDLVSQRHTPALRLTGLCVGIFMFTHFTRSEPFPFLCDVTEFQVVGSVQFAHNIRIKIFCSFIHSFIHSVIHRVCTSSSRRGVAQFVSLHKKRYIVHDFALRNQGCVGWRVKG